MTFRGRILRLTRTELAMGHLPPWGVCLYLLWRIADSLDAILAILAAHK